MRDFALQLMDFYRAGGSGCRPALDRTIISLMSGCGLEVVFLSCVDWGCDLSGPVPILQG